MSHLLKNYRGKIDLIYIDPPFDSKAEYKKKVEIKGIGKTEGEMTCFEEKQYGDIWTNDEYLQFMYERLLLIRELLSDTGSVFLHCDDSKNYLLRCVLSKNELVAGVYDIPDDAGTIKVKITDLLSESLEVEV